MYYTFFLAFLFFVALECSYHSKKKKKKSKQQFSVSEYHLTDVARDHVISNFFCNLFHLPMLPISAVAL